MTKLGPTNPEAAGEFGVEFFHYKEEAEQVPELKRKIERLERTLSTLGKLKDAPFSNPSPKPAGRTGLEAPRISELTGKKGLEAAFKSLGE